MNKELIKKYKKEFDHWLNGGSLLAYHTKLLEWCRVDGPEHWQIPDIHSNAIFIIHDEYVEFRKALAEGKIVQEKSKNWSISNQVWVDSKIIGYKPIHEYRIKPDKPQFEIGDWVKLQYTNDPVLIGRIEKLDVSQAFVEWGKGRSWKSFDKLQLWEPQPNEWCWFKYSIDSNVTFAQFIKKEREEYYAISHTSKTNYFKYCEPFIGTLPTF